MSDNKVVYLCDGDKCNVCDMELCEHTTDIEHAKNFSKYCSGVWCEEEPKTEWLGSYSPYRCGVCGRYSDSKTPYCCYCGRKAVNV
jgi:hypothetical protein